MTDTERFIEYALAFEKAYVDESWGEIERFFCEDASRRASNGGAKLDVDSHGRTEVLTELRRGVESVDKRFDARLPEVLVGPVERDGAVWMDWRLTLKREGLPDLLVEGDHGTYFRDGKIVRIEEQLAPGVAERVALYFENHEARLKSDLSARSGARSSTSTIPVSRSADRMRKLVEAYAAAKSRADVEGALAVCSDGFSLETVSFDITAHGKDEARFHLDAFFAAFPDYRVVVDGMSFGDAVLGCWGSASMTMKGEILGIPPTDRKVTLPIFCKFAFDADGITEERFFFDLAQLADGIGVPIENLRAALAPLRAAATSAAAAA
jgi:predicted ester cyclase